MKQSQAYLKMACGILILFLFSGCANNNKQSVSEYYRNIEIPTEWEPLFKEKEAPKIEFNYDIDTMLLYDVDLQYTPEMKNSLSRIKSILSKENCNTLKSLLHAVSMFDDYIGSKKYENGFGMSRLFESLKTKNLLAFKLFILLFYVNDKDTVKPIYKFVRENSDKFTQEYKIILKLHKEVRLYRIFYQQHLNWVKDRWSEELTKQYLGLTSYILPDDLLEIDCMPDDRLEKIFNVKKFDWKENITFPALLRCKFDYPYKSYFNSEEREKFLQNDEEDKRELLFKIEERIMFQQIRLRYYILENSLDIEMPERFEYVFIDIFSQPEILDKELERVKALFATWEDFAKSVLEPAKE